MCHAVDEEGDGRSPRHDEDQHDDVDGDRETGGREGSVDGGGQGEQELLRNVADDVSDGDRCRHPRLARV